VVVLHVRKPWTGRRGRGRRLRQRRARRRRGRRASAAPPPAMRHASAYAPGSAKEFYKPARRRERRNRVLPAQGHTAVSHGPSMNSRSTTRCPAPPACVRGACPCSYRGEVQAGTEKCRLPHASAQVRANPRRRSERPKSEQVTPGIRPPCRRCRERNVAASSAGINMSALAIGESQAVRRRSVRPAGSVRASLR